MSEFNFNIDGEELLKNLSLGGFVDRKMRAIVGAYCDAFGKKLERWAKEPPYKEKGTRKLTDEELILMKVLAKKGKLKRKENKIDRTPNTMADKHYKWVDGRPEARPSISGGFKWSGDKCAAYVSGDSDNFVYLELAFEKEFAVLYPAVKALEPDFIRGTNNLLK